MLGKLILLVMAAIGCVRCGFPPKSTEKSVSVVNNLLASYNKEVRPNSESGKPTIVRPDFYINSISEIDERSMDYSLHLFFRMRWNDPRLRFSAVNHSILVHPDRLNRLWTPDVYFKNEKEGQFSTLMTRNTLLSISPNGDVLLSQRISLKLSCRMNLYKFPLDNQTCSLEMESYAFTTDDLVLEWTDDAIHWDKDKSINLPDFTFVGTDKGICTTHYSTGTYSCLKAAFFISRKIGYHLTQLFIPSVLIVILSWLSFWIDVNATPARVSLGLLTVLTMTTQSARFPTPRVSYVKALDVWSAACLVFVFGALVEFAIVNVVARLESNKDSKKKKKMANSHPYTIQLENNNIRREPTKVRRRKRKLDITRIETEKPTHSIARRVDAVSRVLFPGLFIFFNVLYFVLYLAVLT